MGMNKEIAEMSVNMQKIQSERDAWQIWLHQLTDWNRRLQAQVRGNLPEKLRTEMQENINRLGQDNENLQEIDNQMKLDNSKLFEKYKQLKAETDALNETGMKLLEKKNEMQASFHKLFEENQQ